MICDLDRELHLGRLARHLRPVVKIDDPHARHYAYRRAGAGPVDPRDDRRAADIVRAHRRALRTDGAVALTPAAPVRPEPSPDDLVALMAEALVRAERFDGLDLDDAYAAECALIAAGFAPLDAGRLVGPALDRARARAGRGALRGAAADALALGALVLGWSGLYCVVCPPAHAAAGPLVTDERLTSFMVFAPIVLAVCCFVGLCWADRGVPARADGDIDAAPEPSPERRRRDADRG